MEKKTWFAYHKEFGWVYCEKKMQGLDKKLNIKILRTGETFVEDPDVLELNPFLYIQEEKYLNRINKNEKEFKIQELIGLKRKNGLIKNVKDLKDYERIVFYKRIFREKKVKSLFHFTASENFENIMESRFLYSIDQLKKQGKSFTNISDELSRSIDSNKKTSNYVRLCYNPEHPMMYVAKKDRGINRFLIIEISIEVVFYEKCLFSDINAGDKNATISDSLEFIENLDLSFATLKKGNYLSLNAEEKKKFQSEILIFEKISKDYFLNHYIKEI
ncbi:MAG: DarT ssDNA thymidine ADP-ribosyltransferase family protein [Chloroherpetonaceae bacterium]